MKVQINKDLDEQFIEAVFPDGRRAFMRRSPESEVAIRGALGETVRHVYVEANDMATPGSEYYGVAAVLPETTAILLYNGQVLLMTGRGIMMYETSTSLVGLSKSTPEAALTIDE